jgi:hypothetical protein
MKETRAMSDATTPLDPVPGIPSPPIDYLEFKRAVYNRMPKLRLGDREFKLVPIEVMSDEAAAEFTRLMAKFDEGTEDAGDAVAFARCIVEDYQGFVDAGGSAMGLLAWLEEVDGLDVAGEGVTEGEGSASTGS